VTLKENIVIFDGECNLCSGAIDFIKKRDTHKVLRFLALQSEEASLCVKLHHISTIDEESVIYIKDDLYYLRSDAILEITKVFPFYWAVFRITKVIPRSIRDSIYNLLAKNRYTLFGNKSCSVEEKI